MYGPQRGLRLLDAALPYEPAGRLGDEPDAEENDDGEEELEADGEAVGEGGLDVDDAAVYGCGDDLGDGQCELPAH